LLIVARWGICDVMQSEELEAPPAWPLTVVVLGTVLFNPILALINANITP
jgi:hypothetical protein